MSISQLNAFSFLNASTTKAFNVLFKILYKRKNKTLQEIIFLKLRSMQISEKIYTPIAKLFKFLRGRGGGKPMRLLKYCEAI